MKIISVLFLSIIILSSCADHRQANTLEDFEKSNYLGKIERETVLVGNIVVPLLDGEWVVISKETNANEGIERLLLGSIYEDSLSSIILIETNLNRKSSKSSMTIQPCNLKKGIYTIFKNKKQETLECYSVTSNSASSLGYQYSLFREGFRYVKEDLKTQVPKYYMYTNHYVSQLTDYLSVTFFWDSHGVVMHEGDLNMGSFVSLLMPYNDRAEYWHPKIVEAFKNRQ